MRVALRGLLTWLGFTEAEPHGPSLPVWIYLSLGVITVVLGTVLIVSGEPAVGVFMVALGVINVGLGIFRQARHEGSGR